MKTKLYLLSIFIMIASNFNLHGQEKHSPKKILVAYFSHSGNTRIIAEQIRKATGADIFEIKPEKDYSKDYQTVVDQAKKEINSNYKPTLKSKMKNIDSYDIVFVGSPCWWSTIAPPVAAFLSNYDLSGKTIIPFMTHEGSGFGKSISDIKKQCPKSKVLEGFSCWGSDINNAQNDINTWLYKIKITK